MTKKNAKITGLYILFIPKKFVDHLNVTLEHVGVRTGIKLLICSY